MNTPLQMLVCLPLAVVASYADTITVGAPGNLFDGDCAPFGCAVEYQQLYGAGLDFSVFLDFASGAPAGTFSRISSFDTSGVADTVQNDTGLGTEFAFSPAASTVQEPSSLALLGPVSISADLVGPKGHEE